MTRDRIEQTAWIICLVGLAGSIIGWIVTPHLFPHAWLAALACWIGWPLGCMALLLIHSITGGRWGEVIRPQLILGVMSLPLVVIAVLPLIPELHALYPWARPDIARDLGNTRYLNVPFVCGRGVLYLALWLGLGGLVLRALRQPDPERALHRLSPFGLIMLMLTGTFSGFDATLSLDPHFNSSIWGMIVAGELVLLALTVATFYTLLISWPERRAIEDLGKLTLGLLVLWGYFVFMQLLIVWNSDLATDAPWYVARSAAWLGNRSLYHLYAAFRGSVSAVAVAANAGIAARHAGDLRHAELCRDPARLVDCDTGGGTQPVLARLLHDGGGARLRRCDHAALSPFEPGPELGAPAWLKISTYPTHAMSGATYPAASSCSPSCY